MVESLPGTVTGVGGADAEQCGLTIKVVASNLDEAPAEARVIGVPPSLAPRVGSTLSIVEGT